MENIKYIGKRNLSCNDGDGNCQKRRRRIIYGFYTFHLGNAPQESFLGYMKDEIDVSGCTKVGEVKAILGDWLNYYNTERYQWQLAKLSPDEY